MRNLFESPEDFPKMPDMYKYDEESGLYMNTPAQWSKSPYLGAVKDKTGNGFAAQIHIPQAVWEYTIRDNPGKWGNKLPDTFFKENGKDRSTIRIGNLRDPRQAAWIVQTILYGNHDTAELIDEYLTHKYILGKKGISAWKETFRDMPKFEGSPLVLADRDEWFAKHKQMDTKAKQDKNIETFNTKAPDKIKQAILAKAAQGGPRKKIFGTNSISLNKLGPIIDKAIAALGVQHFLQGIHVKDPMQFDLSKFVTESDIKTGAFREGFRSGYLVETANHYERFSTEWTEWTDGYLQARSLRESEVSYKRNPEYDVQIGETLGGTQTYPETFPSQIQLDCWVDFGWGMNHYVPHGVNPNASSVQVYPSAERAHAELVKAG